MKLKIKKGDKVRVLTGKDRGKTGTVVRAFPSIGKVLVEGVNMKVKHTKPNKQTKQGGGIISLATPLPVSNVAFIDPKTGAPTRIGRKLDATKGTLVRVAKKSGTTLS